jgi:single-strand DNA-binding protein
MPAYAKVILMGNLARDPEVRTTAGGKSVGSFSIAVNNRYKKEDGTEVEEVSFFDCVAWGRTGEVIKEYLVKGNPIFVEGRLKQETWEKDGVKHYAVRVVVERFQFIGTKAEGGESRPKTSAPKATSSGSQQGTPDVPPIDDGDDIPF